MIESLLSRLEKVRSTGQHKWLACCPAHDDRSPSLSVRLADDDKILLHCFAGCAVNEIVSAIGLSLADLMPQNPQGYDRTRVRPPRFNKSETFDIILHEAIILRIAVQELLTGKTLSDADIRRVSKAEGLLDGIARECRR
jgi:hypothetical protein